MVLIIPAEILQQAQAQTLCRQRQLQQLAIYYNHHLPSPPILVAHGLEHTAKLKCIRALLCASDIRHAVVRSRDCLTQRHLLTKIFATCIRQLDAVDDSESYDRVDSLNSLVVNMQRLFEGREGKFVLVIDGIDKQKGASYTLLPALAKLGDLVANLSVILTSSSSRLNVLHRSGVPFISFQPYSRNEAISMILKQPIPMPRNLPDTFPTIPEPQLSSIYKSFVTTVYDTLTVHTTSNSQQAFGRTCEKLWPRFIWPMLSGETPQSRNKQPQQSSIGWDFARLLARNRSLFQKGGEKALFPSLTLSPTEPQTFDQLISAYQDPQPPHQNHITTQASEPDPDSDPTLLKFFSALLLLSSYLASHTPTKHDIILFSRLSSSSTHKRKYLSSALSKSRTGSTKGGVRKTPTKRNNKSASTISTTNDTTPRKSKTTDPTGDGLAGEKTPKSTRLLLEKTSNIPRPFTLERVIAILRVIHPDGVRRGVGDKVYGEMGELEKLRLVVRCGEGGKGDDGVLEEKWRVNVSREFVVSVGRAWGVGLEGWEID